MFNLSTNPYIAGNPVGSGDSFVGRADILREVNRVFSRPKENSIVLFGQRRIGKTSVLQYLQQQLLSNNSAIPLYFDLQDKSKLSVDEVVTELAASIASMLKEPTPDLGDNPQYFFEKEWLPETLKKLGNDTPIVLLFDEFDVLASNSEDQAGQQFFPYLRKLLSVNTQQLKFVFVIGRNVKDLATIVLSLFKGIPTTRVSLLNEEDTHLLCRLSEDNNTLIWPNNTLDYVWQLTNGHAFFTQQLCSHVWDNLYDNEPEDTPTVTVETIDAVISDVLSASRNTLEWLWDGLPPAERVVSSALAEAGQRSISDGELQKILHESGVRIIIRELEDAPRLLKDWDLLEADDTGYHFRVELLRRWIKNNKPLSRVQDELDRIQPLAETLFQAAQQYFQGGDLEESESALRKAIGFNPNHVRANQTLADILLAEERLDEAEELLSRLYDYQPTSARSRLTQALLGQAIKLQDDDDKLKIYQRVLEIDPQQPEATNNFKKIWKKRADALFEAQEFRSAEDAYKYAQEREKAEQSVLLARRQELDITLAEIYKLDSERKYPKCLRMIKAAKNIFSDLHQFEDYEIKIQEKQTVDTLYTDAQKHYANEDLNEAQTVLSKIISIDPNYLPSIILLYNINTKSDLEKNLNDLIKLKTKVSDLTTLGKLTKSTVFQLPGNSPLEIAYTHEGKYNQCKAKINGNTRVKEKTNFINTAKKNKDSDQTASLWNKSKGTLMESKTGVRKLIDSFVEWDRGV